MVCFLPIVLFPSNFLFSSLKIRFGSNIYNIIQISDRDCNPDCVITLKWSTSSRVSKPNNVVKISTIFEISVFHCDIRFDLRYHPSQNPATRDCRKRNLYFPGFLRVKYMTSPDVTFCHEYISAKPGENPIIRRFCR
jgi:hypothetical protein